MLLHGNVVKIFLVLQEGPKVGLLQLFSGKTALIYSVVTIYLGLCPRIMKTTVGANFSNPKIFKNHSMWQVPSIASHVRLYKSFSQHVKAGIISHGPYIHGPCYIIRKKSTNYITFFDREPERSQKLIFFFISDNLGFPNYPIYKI